MVDIGLSKQVQIKEIDKNFKINHENNELNQIS